MSLVEFKSTLHPSHTIEIVRDYQILEGLAHNVVAAYENHECTLSAIQELARYLFSQSQLNVADL